MICVLLLVLLCFIHVQTKLTYHDFPTAIPKFEIRNDVYTNRPVKSGGAHNLKKRVTLAEFKKHMQCVDNEPNFNYNGGALSLMKAMKPSKETIELLCVYREHRCHPWRDCQKRLEQYKESQNMTKKLDGHFNFNHFFLFRIINGELFYDWPWGIHRFDHKIGDNEVIKLMKIVLPAISDIKNSSFFAGGETASLPHDFPFPLFSSAPKLGFVDMPWPWLEAWRISQHLYFDMKERRLNINNDTEYHTGVQGYLEWNKKTPKAAFFGTYEVARAIMFDAGRRNPDLFDIGFSFIDCNHPWNPLSTEDCMEQINLNAHAKTNFTHLPSGYIAPFANFVQRPYHPGAYKYVIVPMGNEAESTSGRLPILLANSGAVVLMPRMPFVYHFSAQLKPWVHYVPLAYSGADVEEKVRWLRDHDDLARQIADNARNFARSFLRLEDYYCYAVNAMEMLAEIEEGTNATIPFQPIKIRNHLPESIRGFFRNDVGEDENR